VLRYDDTNLELDSGNLKGQAYLLYVNMRYYF